jgi:hypothetical protein
VHDGQRQLLDLQVFVRQIQPRGYFQQFAEQQKTEVADLGSLVAVDQRSSAASSSRCSSWRGRSSRYS